MLFGCPWLLCQAGATYAAKRAALRAALGASIRQPGSSKGTVAIASMHDASLFMCAGFTWHLSDAVKKNTRFTRGFRDFRRGAEPPKATQNHPKRNGCERDEAMICARVHPFWFDSRREISQSYRAE